MCIYQFSYLFFLSIHSPNSNQATNSTVCNRGWLGQKLLSFVDLSHQACLGCGEINVVMNCLIGSLLCRLISTSIMGLATDTWEKPRATHVMSVQTMQGTLRVLGIIKSSAAEVSLSQVGWAAHFR